MQRLWPGVRTPGKGPDQAIRMPLVHGALLYGSESWAGYALPFLEGRCHWGSGTFREHQAKSVYQTPMTTEDGVVLHPWQREVKS
jgi:hypothetical protein